MTSNIDIKAEVKHNEETLSNNQGTTTKVTRNSECRSIPSHVGTLQKKQSRIAIKCQQNIVQSTIYWGIKADTGKVS